MWVLLFRVWDFIIGFDYIWSGFDEKVVYFFFFFLENQDVFLFGVFEKIL